MHYIFILGFILFVISIIYQLIVQTFTRISNYFNTIPQSATMTIAFLLLFFVGSYLLKTLYQYYIIVNTQYKSSLKKVQEYEVLVAQIKSIERK
jgi:uncharacterized membrane protein YbhN (UPF0104 family)